MRCKFVFKQVFLFIFFVCFFFVCFFFFMRNGSVKCSTVNYLDRWNFRKRMRIKFNQKVYRVFSIHLWLMLFVSRLCHSMHAVNHSLPNVPKLFCRITGNTPFSYEFLWSFNIQCKVGTSRSLFSSLIGIFIEYRNNLWLPKLLLYQN